MKGFLNDGSPHPGIQRPVRAKRGPDVRNSRVIRLLLGLAALGMAGCARAPHPRPLPCGTADAVGAAQERKALAASPKTLIRVAIITRQRELRLQTPENFSLTGFSLSPEETSGRAVTLTYQRLSSASARVQTLGNGGLKVNGECYQGTLRIYPDQGGTLTVVNELGLEDYVAGVLVGEVPRDWPLEALKAQAIAARTFALVKRAEARQADRSWDLENHALFQVYKGSTDAGENIRRAVRETEGKILTWDGQPIQAFYHSNCGGETCRASDVWGSDLPYLRAVSCRYCRSGPHYEWSSVVPVESMSKKLREAHVWIGEVASINPLERDASGRVLRVEILDTENHRKVLRGNEFRNAVGADLLRCTRFNVESTQEGFRLSGKGWGHGVGMCQEGAYGMALAGFRAQEILRKYYPGTLIENMGTP